MCILSVPSQDFHLVDWGMFSNALKDWLLWLPAISITSTDQFYKTVTDFTSIIQAVIWDNNLVPTQKLCLHTKR